MSAKDKRNPWGRIGLLDERFKSWLERTVPPVGRLNRRCDDWCIRHWKVLLSVIISLIAAIGGVRLILEMLRRH